MHFPAGYVEFCQNLQKLGLLEVDIIPPSNRIKGSSFLDKSVHLASALETEEAEFISWASCVKDVIHFHKAEVLHWNEIKERLIRR